ncbi:arabinan endo-1,5-alpha-L-arabinosidase [Sphingobacterium sp. ML3W]|uniref:family 43 glycosylhydrolase n=1 Tax=Sphingobacterium sp. ML3W TaxID=1538644 RepID=UPI0004F6DB5A|nr:family 43 glycosylhydrolase [Sphingobacterium sp. ML3W]AIM37609.1 arabinan endo-1,5-alpha-L-arabinosidase [Sphingobacterium sp. ML3W]
MVIQLRQHYSFLLCSIGILSMTYSCGVFDRKAHVAGDKSSQYMNPVFEPILADPTVIRDVKTGSFYAYGTEDNWGDGKGNRLMPILKSEDLVHWKEVANVFQDKPHWKDRGGLWAPDINKINNQYVLYYSYSLWGDPDPGIGVAVANNPDGPFEDRGKLFVSSEVQVPNSIDPSLYEEGNKKFLFWGSFGDGPSQGIHGIPLTSDGTAVIDLQQKFKVAAGDWEAAMIHKRDGYYYLFGSKGSCCEGANSKYHVLVARSKSLKGPYLDRSGKDINTRGAGTVVLQGNDKVVGPGHHSKIIKDDKGTDWLLYHAIQKHEGKVSSGASRRMLMLDKVIWTAGWPKIGTGEPGQSLEHSPVFKKMKDDN